MHGAFWNYLQSFNVNRAGFIIVGMFVGTWLIAIAVWHFAHIEEKWAVGMEAAATRNELAALEGMPEN